MLPEDLSESLALIFAFYVESALTNAVCSTLGTGLYPVIQVVLAVVDVLRRIDLPDELHVDLGVKLPTFG